MGGAGDGKKNTATLSYDTRLRVRSVNVAGHYSLLARPFDNYRFLMPQ